MRNRIDPLIAERAPWLFADNAPVRAIRSFTESLLRYPETIEIAKEVRDLSSAGIMANISARIARHVQIDGIDHIPAAGPALVVANHPTGIADGVILHHAFVRRRPDLFIFANSDILRVLPQMSDLILPVEWRKNLRTHEKTRTTMKLTEAALSNGRMGVIFPSGRLAKRRHLRLYERDWMHSAVLIAQKFDVPVIPVNIQARNSALFYLLDLIHPTLRDITLFYEMLNKDRQPYRVNVSEPIAARDLPRKRGDAIALLRDRTLSLGRGGDPSVSLVSSSGPMLPFLRTVRP
jgi:putative hemolysin